MMYSIVIIISMILICGVIVYKLFLDYMKIKLKHNYDELMFEITRFIDRYDKYKKSNDMKYYQTIDEIMSILNRFDKQRNNEQTAK